MDDHGILLGTPRVAPVRAVNVADLPNLLQAARAQPFQLDRTEISGQGFRAFDPAALPQGGFTQGGVAPAQSWAPAFDDVAPAPPESFTPTAEALRTEVAPPPAEPEPGFDEGWTQGHHTGMIEGLELGREEGRADMQARLGKALDLLATAHARLTSPSAADTAGISRSILSAVRALAAERAGQAIDAEPAPFLRRVERMAERVGQGMTQVELRLNPADIEAIAAHLAQSPQLAKAHITAAPELDRGDIDLRVPGVHLSDLIDPPEAAE